MQPNDRTPNPSPEERATPYDELNPPVEPIAGEDPLVDRNGQVPGVLPALGSDRPLSGAGIVMIWALPLLVLAALALTAFFTWHRHPTDDGKPHQVGDQAAPNTRPDHERR